MSREANLTHTSNVLYRSRSSAHGYQHIRLL